MRDKESHKLRWSLDASLAIFLNEMFENEESIWKEWFDINKIDRSDPQLYIWAKSHLETGVFKSMKTGKIRNDNECKKPSSKLSVLWVPTYCTAEVNLHTIMGKK